MDSDRVNSNSNILLIADLVVVEYSGWNSSCAPPYPEQLNRSVDHQMVVRQLLRGRTEDTSAVLQKMLLSSATETFVRSAFWYFFLEHFSLLDPAEHVEVYRKALAQAALEEQQANHLRQVGLGPAVAVEKTANLLNRKRPKKGKPINSPKPPAAGEPRPRHLLSSAQAGLTLCPKTIEPIMSQSSNSASAWNMQHPQTTSSRCSSTSWVSSWSSARDNRAVVLGETISGRIDLPAVGALLASAGQLEAPFPLDTTDIPRAQASYYISEAVALVKREQDALFSAMAKCFVDQFLPLSSAQRDVVLGAFPDLVSRLIVQLLYRILPYFRTVLTDEVKRQVKKTVTYWVNGVENADISLWNVDLQQKKIEIEERKAEIERLRARAAAQKPRSSEETTDRPDLGASGRGLTQQKNQGISAWKMIKGTAKNVKAAQVVASLSTDLAYTKGLEELRQAFDELRRPKAPIPSPGSGPQQSSIGSPTYSFSRTTVQPSKPLSRGNQALQRHAFFHRHAPQNKRCFWNELGRRKGAGIFPHSDSAHFNLGDISPLLQRYLMDMNRFDLVHASPRARLLEWSC